MNRVMNWLQMIGLRSVMTIALTLTLVIAPAFVSGSLVQAQASPRIIQSDAKAADQGVIKKIQQEAEDLGDSPDRPIGQTGLKNIKKLGENIKETTDLNVRQKGAIYNTNEKDKVGALKEAQKETEKRAK